MTSRPFPAQYRGVCPECDEPIRPGDPVRYDEEDDLVHDACADSVEDRSLRAERAEPTVCRSCYTIHAGECL